MIRLPTILLRSAIAASLVLAPLCASAELVVIVSAKNPVPALRADQVADIFLGQVTSFPEGGRAVAVDHLVHTAQRDEFYRKLTGKTPSLLKIYWSKMIFTGRGEPPRELFDSAAVRRAVADNPGMIGYLDRNELDSSVKMVLALP